VLGRVEDKYSVENKVNIVSPTQFLALSRHEPEQGSLSLFRDESSAGGSLELSFWLVGSGETSSLSIQYNRRGVEFSIDISNDS
jgi:hypothetical protein